MLEEENVSFFIFLSSVLTTYKDENQTGFLTCCLLLNSMTNTYLFFFKEDLPYSF